MIHIELPWPSGALSPNARAHWRVRAEAVRDARENARILTSLEAPVRFNSGNIRIEYEFHPPDARHYDSDNLHARVKAMQDGICDALGINDERFNPVTITRCGKDDGAGCVIVKIGEEVKHGLDI